MAGTELTGSDTRQERRDHASSDQQMRILLVEALFEQLSGTWKLDRRLQSANASEPAGHCSGTATFTRREPSVFINDQGKLETASSELIYHEEGYFEMQQASTQSDVVRFPFSRKYAWRLQPVDTTRLPVFSIWFTKPGTEKIDYLFHKINMTVDEASGQAAASSICLQGEACHLCEEDLYSSSYTFDYVSDAKMPHRPTPLVRLKSWTMLHEVRGPNKDQVIETTFTQ